MNQATYDNLQAGVNYTFIYNDSKHGGQADSPDVQYTATFLERLVNNAYNVIKVKNYRHNGIISANDENDDYMMLLFPNGVWKFKSVFSTTNPQDGAGRKYRRKHRKTKRRRRKIRKGRKTRKTRKTRRKTHK